MPSKLDQDGRLKPKEKISESTRLLVATVLMGKSTLTSEALAAVPQEEVAALVNEIATATGLNLKEEHGESGQTANVEVANLTEVEQSVESLKRTHYDEIDGAFAEAVTALREKDLIDNNLSIAHQVQSIEELLAQFIRSSLDVATLVQQSGFIRSQIQELWGHLEGVEQYKLLISQTIQKIEEVKAEILKLERVILDMHDGARLGDGMGLPSQIKTKLNFLLRQLEELSTEIITRSQELSKELFPAYASKQRLEAFGIELKRWEEKLEECRAECFTTSFDDVLLRYITNIALDHKTLAQVDEIVDLLNPYFTNLRAELMKPKVAYHTIPGATVTEGYSDNSDESEFRVYSIGYKRTGTLHVVKEMHVLVHPTKSRLPK